MSTGARPKSRAGNGRRLAPAVGRLLADLEKDRITPSPLVRRIYHVTIKAAVAAGATAITRPVERTVHASRRPKLTFLASDPREQRLSGPSLRHLAGVTCMRHLLEADSRSWENSADRARAPLIPDALWRPSEPHRWSGGAGLVAIEYDAGSYSPTRVRDKLLVFSDPGQFSAQVWGVATEPRVQTIRRAADELGIDASVIVAPWWT